MSEAIPRRQFLGESAIGAAGLAASVALSSAGAAEALADEPPRKITVGLITQAGGAHLGLYFQALAQTDEVAAVFLADPDSSAEAEARRILQAKLARVYKSRDELLAAEKPAMALVSVEAREGPAAIGAALKAGCHVLAEKPACVSADDFAQLAALADQRKLHLMLALANRLNPEVLEARRLVAAGEIGKVYGVEMHIIQDQTRLTAPEYHKSWFADRRRAGGGHLSWIGIHWLDLAMYLTGAKIEQVAGFCGNVGGQPIDIEDSAAVAMRFDNGTFGTLTSGYFLDKGYQSHLAIWGSAGWLRIESDLPNTVRWQSTRPGRSGTIEKFVGPGDFNPYVAYVRAAVRASAGLQAPPITTHESLAVLKAVFTTYRAAAEGKTLTLA